MGDTELEEFKALVLTNRKSLEVEGLDEPVIIFTVEQDGKPVAIAVEAQGEGGYGGNIGVMAGFNIESGNLAGIGITTHSETPGVGSKVEGSTISG